jgi:hypothetical protein
VLPGEPGNKAIERESFGLHFGPDVCNAHPVGGRDGNRRILFPILHQHQLAVLFQRSPKTAKHLLRMPELVVHVNEQDQIDCVRGKIRIGVGAQDNIDVRQMLRLRLALDDLKHSGLNVVGDDLARGSNQRR